MMSAVAFDTLKFVKRLEAAGVVPAQAEATPEAFSDAISQDLATKMDLLQLEQRMTYQLAALDQKFVNLEHKFIDLEQIMTIKLGSLLVAGIGIIVTAQHLWR
jgi:hypothetical protein